MGIDAASFSFEGRARLQQQSRFTLVGVLNLQSQNLECPQSQSATINNHSATINFNLTTFVTTASINGHVVDANGAPLSGLQVGASLQGNNNTSRSSNSSGAFVERFGPSSLAAFTVSLNSASSSPVTVSYSTADGTAMAGRHYTASSDTLTFAPGQTTRTIIVLLILPPLSRIQYDTVGCKYK